MNFTNVPSGLSMFAEAYPHLLKHNSTHICKNDNSKNNNGKHPKRVSTGINIDDVSEGVLGFLNLVVLCQFKENDYFH